MSARPRPIIFTTTLFAILISSATVQAQAPAPAAAPPPGQLTVERIFTPPGLSGRLTRGIAWSPDGTKISYLETKGSGKEAKTELWLMNAATGTRSPLISSEKYESALPAQPSKAASQATGLGRHAPAQYQWAPAGDAILFESSKALGWFDLKTQTTRVLVSGKEDLADPKISPDGKFVSYIRDHNLWLVSTADAKVRALTSGGSEEIRKGEVDWVYPEELELMTAYWWSPDSSSIAFLEFNESKVNQFSITDYESYAGEAEPQRYPIPGTSNPVVRVFVANISGGQPRLMDTGANSDIYIPRVTWHPDSHHLAIQRLNRLQSEIDILFADTATGKSTTLLTDKDQYWINVSNDFRFLADGKRFLWSSERTGYRHIYLYELSGKQLAQLTKGEWEVSAIESVDESKNLVYFSATEKSPMERHLYSAGLDGSGFQRLTTNDGTHAILFAPHSAFYLDTFSNTAAPARQDLFHADGKKAATVNENQVSDLAQYHLSPVEFFSIKSHDGMMLNCSIIKPPDFNPAKRYPVIVYTYGGPHAQVVVNEWEGSTFLWHQMMTQKGYIIFALDNRGSSGRGHLFEEPIHFRFGAQELSDQRDGAAWLRLQPYVDPKRIGIWGWSYGGHMTLHAMFEASEFFKVGFAGGPVTDWHFYDTIYTERYIGLLPGDEENYQESSPIKNADQLHGKLLIAHGTGDDNVHYSNTLMLIDELLKAGKYVEVMTFPGRGHGVTDPPARLVLMNRVTQFFLDNL